MPALITDVGGAASNSYVTAVEAEAYFDERMNAAPWAAISSDDDAVARALISATRRLDQEIYMGYKTDPDQALQWPRTGVTDRDGGDIPEDVLPTELKQATMEQALYMAGLGTTDPSMPTGLEPFKRLKTTTVEMEMRTDRDPGEMSGLAPAVLRLLYGLLITYDEDSGDEQPGTFRIVRA